MKNKIDISVIIPMYNAALFIENAVASVLMQQPHRFTFEIIIIDDFSTDNSIELIRNINDNRIKLVELKKNGGLSNARNKGLGVAKGEWIQFLDSDDKLSNDLYYKFEKAMKPFYNCYLFSLINEFQDYTLKQTITEIKDKRAFGHFGAVWNKFIKKDICVEFKENFIFEDVIFIIEMLNNVDLNIALIPDVFYLYNRKNPNSIMANFSKEEFYKMYSNLYHRIEECDDLTKMFMLEIFVALIFDKTKPFTLRLKIAIKTLLKLYKYLPSVYFNQNRHSINNSLIKL